MDTEQKTIILNKETVGRMVRLGNDGISISLDREFAVFNDMNVGDLVEVTINVVKKNAMPALKYKKKDKKESEALQPMQASNSEVTRYLGTNVSISSVSRKEFIEARKRQIGYNSELSYKRKSKKVIPTIN